VIIEPMEHMIKRRWNGRYETCPAQIGLYEIECSPTGHCYIGMSAYDMGARLSSHRNQLKRGKHPNCFLQRLWDSYGEHNFEFKVILSIYRNRNIPEDWSWENHEKITRKLKQEERRIIRQKGIAVLNVVHRSK